MKIDIAGRIRNTKLAYRNCLQPLYEAVINSLDAIEDKGNRDGFIEIKFHRKGQIELELEERPAEPIVAFEIVDNGIGFDSTNFDAFLTADTPLKKNRGGKGVGRFIWLKAFRQASIDSVYQENGKKYRRKFRFGCTADGIENIENDEVSQDAAMITRVFLDDFHPKYQDLCPKRASVIARRIVEHCLEYFIFQKPPKIQLIDETLDQSIIDLSDIFEEEFKPESKPRQFKINNEVFTIHDVLISKPYDANHKAHFCAHKRVVLSETLSKKVPHLDSALYDENGSSFAYAAYISGYFFDERVEADRTDFRISSKANPLFPDEPSWQNIHENVFENVKDFLQPYTTKSREQALERVETYVQTESPKYRHLLTSHTDAIQDLSPHLSEQNLEIELHKLHYEVKHELKKQAIEQLAYEESDDESEWEEHRKQFREFFRLLNDVAKSELADYVVHRKTVISFLEKLLGRANNGKYAKEEAIHEIIFPLRHTSHNLDYENHNLWIVDERLVYHRYLASDIPFDHQYDSPAIVESGGRPDILIFNKAFALVEEDFPFNSVVIVEFKRPERDDYTEDKSPIRQVLKYVDQIRDGKAKDKRGHTIQVNPSIPFYCYIVATLTPRLKDEAKLDDLTPTPDLSGYFGYKKHYQAYIEIISFDKLIADAKKRNKAFFDKLNL